MITKHTPGNWTTRPTASLGPQWAVYPEGAGPDIAIIYDHDDNTEANARLIASAPDLLSACHALLACRDYGRSTAEDEWMEAETIARATIARATGGQT